jgi:nitrilase
VSRAFFTVAVIQAAPVFMDREATTDKACELILEAGKHGARLVVFPESFIPCYPHWVWSVPAREVGMLNELYAEFLANAVTIPDDSLDKVCRIARRAKTFVVLGVSERNAEASGASLYSTLVFIDAQGQIRGKHRKLVPTGGERMVWAQGDGSTLEVYDTPIGRIGGLVGWENYMPLALYSLYAAGIQIHVAATWDRGEPWLSTLRHLAKEGGMFVSSPCIVLPGAAIPERYSFKAKFYGEVGEWINTGGSAMVNPNGEIAAGPVSGKEAVLYAEIDREQLYGPKWLLDIAGHYARPDVFQLVVNRKAREHIVHAGTAADVKGLNPLKGLAGEI